MPRTMPAFGLIVEISRFHFHFALWGISAVFIALAMPMLSDTAPRISLADEGLADAAALPRHMRLHLGSDVPFLALPEEAGASRRSMPRFAGSRQDTRLAASHELSSRYRDIDLSFIAFI